MVSKRVYFLMKKRLLTEVDREPPLFPWETEVTEYTEEVSEELSSSNIQDETNSVPTGHDKEAPPPPSAS
jgi:hypothetical protein